MMNCLIFLQSGKEVSVTCLKSRKTSTKNKYAFIISDIEVERGGIVKIFVSRV